MRVSGPQAMELGPEGPRASQAARPLGPTSSLWGRRGPGSWSSDPSPCPPASSISTAGPAHTHIPCRPSPEGGRSVSRGGSGRGEPLARQECVSCRDGGSALRRLDLGDEWQWEALPGRTALIYCCCCENKFTARRGAWEQHTGRRCCHAGPRGRFCRQSGPHSGPSAASRPSAGQTEHPGDSSAWPGPRPVLGPSCLKPEATEDVGAGLGGSRTDGLSAGGSP